VKAAFQQLMDGQLFNHLTCWKVNSWDGTPWRWCQQVPKHIRVLVRQS